MGESDSAFHAPKCDSADWRQCDVPFANPGNPKLAKTRKSMRLLRHFQRRSGEHVALQNGLAPQAGIFGYRITRGPKSVFASPVRDQSPRSRTRYAADRPDSNPVIAAAGINPESSYPSCRGISGDLQLVTGATGLGLPPRPMDWNQAQRNWLFSRLLPPPAGIHKNRWQY